MIEKNVFLTSVLLAFGLFVFLYRCWDVFVKRYGEPGRVYYRWTLAVLSILHFVVGISAILEYLFFTTSYNWIIGFAAFLFFVAGQLLRNWAIKVLGSFHSPQIEIKPDHKLIKLPPYCYLRHPYYLGVILEVGCTPLIFNAYFTFLFYLFTYLPMVLTRIYLEERILSNYFGTLYKVYQTEVAPFMIFSLKSLTKNKSKRKKL